MHPATCPNKHQRKGLRLQYKLRWRFLGAIQTSGEWANTCNFKAVRVRLMFQHFRCSNCRNNCNRKGSFPATWSTLQSTFTLTCIAKTTPPLYFCIGQYLCLTCNGFPHFYDGQVYFTQPCPFDPSFCTGACTSNNLFIKWQCAMSALAVVRATFNALLRVSNSKKWHIIWVFENFVANLHLHWSTWG